MRHARFRPRLGADVQHQASRRRRLIVGGECNLDADARQVIGEKKSALKTRHLQGASELGAQQRAQATVQFRRRPANREAGDPSFGGDEMQSAAREALRREV